MVTIFTPTYNRAELIVRLYNSICRQGCTDFEWLIVDDGSTDNTDEEVKAWQAKATFPIRYYKQPNGGKYRAFNRALELAEGELFFTVDSDDYLPDNAIATIINKADLLKGDDIIGLMTLKAYPDGNIIGKPYSEGIAPSTSYHLERKGEGGERSIILRTEMARRFPFPDCGNEKFVTESVVYDRYALAGLKYVVTNDILTICEYQPEGLSSNPHKLMISNPTGYVYYYAQRINLAGSAREALPDIIRYHAFRLMAKRNDIRPGKYKILTAALRPAGYITKRYYLNGSKA